MSMLRGSGVALYNLTLSTATAIHHAVYGNFSAARQQELVVSRGKVLQLLRPNQGGQVQVIASVEVFGQIRSLATFRLPGTPTDYVVVGSDSGRIVILTYSEPKRAFVKVHQETFGRSGCRRIVPGQFVACDPAGRAVMVAAVEKQKFLYVLNRDSGNQLTISSPLEAHKARHIVFALAALDNGFDNPLFAAVELDYTDADEDSTGEGASEAQKHLVYYELDLGLNHVTRKWSAPCDNGANMLIPVPGDSLKVRAEDQPGPGGVLVCADNFVMYMHEGFETVQTLIPRRQALPAERSILLLASATHKKAGQFVVLAQSEYGDIYKISLEYDSPTNVTELKVKYFDTVPPCTAMCILKTGFLFAAAETGDHGFYEFLDMGDDDGVNEASSRTVVQDDEGFQPIFFEPQPLKNLQLVDQMMSLAPLTDLKVSNLLNEEVPQMYAACGRGARSTLRMLRAGVSVSEVAVTDLPARPTAVWTVKAKHDDAHHDLIVISFSDDKATLVLRVGETVAEVNDSGLEGKTATLGMQLLGNDSMLQVHQGGLRLIGADRRINKWAPPGRRSVAACAMNSHQVVIALLGSDVIYFELNPSGQLLEVEKKDGLSDVTCLAIAAVPEGRQRSSFVVAGCSDQTVRVLSLEPSDCLKIKATQTVSAPPVSVMLLEASISAAGDTAAARALFLHVGLQTGLLVRTEVDPLSGRLSELRTRFLGTRGPTLLPVATGGAPSMMALSTRPWLGHLREGRFQMVPLAYDALDYVAPFFSESVPEGLVAVVRNAAGTGTLRVLTIERLAETFTQKKLQLAYTPRRMLVDAERRQLIVAESDKGAVPYPERKDFAEAATALGLPSPFTPAGDLAPELAGLEEQFGAPRGGATQWGSCLRVVSPYGGELQTLSVLHLENNEAALCMCLVAFANQGAGQAMLAVGTARNMQFYPRQADEGFIRIYRFAPDGCSLQLVHRTPLGATIPSAVAEFQGRLLVGCGRSLRLMECGKKKMLRKCEYSGLPSIIVSIHAMGSRIYVGDAHESFHYMRHKRAENTFYVFADDSTPRYLSCALHLDYDSMAGADKFGNVFVTRMPADISLQVEDDPTGGKFAAVGGGTLGAADHKVEPVINFHLGDLVMSMQLTALQSGGQEMIVYGTISGAIGVLVPFVSGSDLDLFAQIEMHMRQLSPSLVGRDHLAFRGAFFPVKDVVDGDLCERFVTLTAEKQRTVSEETDRPVGQLLKQLEDMRNKVL